MRRFLTSLPVAILFIPLFGPPAAVRAQSGAGAVFRPSLTVIETHDSNLFFAPSARAADFITRVTPEIESEYRTPQWTLSGAYSFDAERFAQHVNMSRAHARQNAFAGIDYRRSERTTVSVGGVFSTTQTPGELVRETGLDFARAFAQRVEARSSLTHRLNPVTTGALDYTFTEDRIEGGPGSRTHTATIGVDRRISERDRVEIGYRLREFMFGGTALPSHALSFGWTRSITGRAIVAVSGGPNMTAGSPGVDLTASLRSRFKAGEIILAYLRTQTTIFGLADVVQTQNISTAATWTVGRSLQIQVAPAVYQSRLETLRADVLRMNASVMCALSPSVSLELSLDASRQHGLLFAGRGDDTIPRYQTTLRLIAGSSGEPR